MGNKNIVGISAQFHDSACCVLKNGKLVAAAQEERFSRLKHDSRIPRLAFRFCLEEAGLDIAQISCIAYYENPQRKAARQIWTLLDNNPPFDLLLRIDPGRAEHEIRTCLGYEGEIRWFEHHQTHAASSFFYSGFAEAAIMTMDGVGEWKTGIYGYGCGRQIACVDSVSFPHSLGLLYSTITDYLGFSVNDSEYKVMGLAPYGRPIYADRIRRMVDMPQPGQYRLNLKYFDFQRADRMYSDELPELLGGSARASGSPICQFHQDIASSLQTVLEEIVLAGAEYVHGLCGYDALCLAGGVALNCVANRRIHKDGPFKRMFVQPAASDAGCALGAAALAWYEEEGASPIAPMQHDFLGPAFTSADVLRILGACGVPASDFRGREKELLHTTADLLAQGMVVGWMQGRMEFGPRSLGARSILADPRRPEMRDRINALIKQREGFRPFAPAVLASKASTHFDVNYDLPFMLETCQVTSSLQLPAVRHVDGSARVQTVSDSTNPRFAALLEAFDRRTGCPILLNTSFNMSDEPIVCSPADALVCFFRSEIDALVLEDFLIERRNIGETFPLLQRSFETGPTNIVSDRVYAMF